MDFIGLTDYLMMAVQTLAACCTAFCAFAVAIGVWLHYFRHKP